MDCVTRKKDVSALEKSEKEEWGNIPCSLQCIDMRHNAYN